MARYMFVLAVAACLAVAAVAQSPAVGSIPGVPQPPGTTVATAPTPAPAAGSFPTVPIDTQKQEAAFQAQQCIKGLAMIYDVYTYTGNWSMVPNLPFADGAHYTFCYTLPPVGTSALEMLCVFHYLPQVGRTARQLINSGNGAQGSFEQLIAAARTVEGRDNSYWSTISQTFANPPYVDIHLLGSVIYGKTAADQGTRYVCSCILNILPTVDAAGTPVTAAPAGGGLGSAPAAAPAIATAPVSAASTTAAAPAGK